MVGGVSVHAIENPYGTQFAATRRPMDLRALAARAVAVVACEPGVGVSNAWLLESLRNAVQHRPAIGIATERSASTARLEEDSRMALAAVTPAAVQASGRMFRLEKSRKA